MKNTHYLFLYYTQYITCCLSTCLQTTDKRYCPQGPQSTQCPERPQRIQISASTSGQQQNDLDVGNEQHEEIKQVVTTVEITDGFRVDLHKKF